MMAEDKIEEETYSLIFTSLKHPIRRQILRMLADEPLTYSEILETLNIDSGHLSYHLESLGDLTVHDENGHYQLSSFGVATVKLMGGVEEQTPAKSHRKFKLRRILAKVYPVILVLALIGASFHFVTYATVASTRTLSTDQVLPLPFYVDAGQTFEVNVTLDHWSSINEEDFGIRADHGGFVMSLVPLRSTFTDWDEASVWIDPKANQTLTPTTTYLVQLTLTKDNCTGFYDDIPLSFFTDPLFGDDVVHVTLHSDNDINGVPVTIYSQNELGDPSKLLVDIHLPNGDVLTDSFHWTTPAFRSDRASSLSAPVTEPGNYSFRIKNNNQCDWDGSIMVTIQLQHFEKPCFYWGVAGFIIALGYVALVTISTIKTRHRN
jgi:DNA-binding transcriptional ArsR family regulator